MAADGSIIIDTKIDASGMRDYVAELKNLEKEAKKTDAAIESMRAKMGRHLELGGSTEDRQYRRMQYDLAQLEIKQADVEEAIERTTNAYNSATQVSLENTKEEVQNSEEKTQALDRVRESVRKVGEESEKAQKKASRHHGLSLKRILAYSLGIHGLHSVFSKMRSAAKEAFGELAKANPQFGAALDSFKGALETLKMNVGAAIMPIAEAVLPILTQLANMLSIAAVKVQEFFAALTGKTTIQKVKSVGNAVAGVGGAVEKALAAYDKLDVISSSKGGGGGSGGSGGYGGYGGSGIEWETQDITQSKAYKLAQDLKWMVTSPDSKVANFLVKSAETLVEAGEIVQGTVKHHDDILEMFIDENPAQIIEDYMNATNGLPEFIRGLGKAFLSAQVGAAKFGESLAEVNMQTKKDGGIISMLTDGNQDEIMEDYYNAVSGLPKGLQKFGAFFLNMEGVASTFGAGLADSIHGEVKKAEPQIMYEADAVANKLKQRMARYRDALRAEDEEQQKKESEKINELVARYAKAGGNLAALEYLNAYDLEFKIRLDSDGNSYIEWINSLSDQMAEQAAEAGKRAGNGFLNAWEAVLKTGESLSSGVKSAVSDLADKAVSIVSKVAPTTAIPAIAAGTVTPTSTAKATAASVTSGISSLTGGMNNVVNLVLNGKQIAQAVWDENEKKYKQTGV